jgi:histidinol dehydrogenase
MARQLDTRAADFDAAFSEFLSEKRESAADVDAVVAAVIADVRTRGDEALCEYTARWDRIELAPGRLRITPGEVAAACDAAPAAAVAALEIAADRIRAYHEGQRPKDESVRDGAGVVLGVRWTAIASVGIYVPGGTAAYPSSVLMNALPARIAGVDRLVMAVPTPNGELNPLVLAAARLAGVDEIYRVGGAQAVAALAFGTATIAAVDKIAGPGNAYVAAAKRQVFGRVGIDSIAGPSEILVVADAECDPEWIAADLLAQAEHDTVAQSILMTDDAGFAAAVAGAVERRLENLDRSEIARASWRDFGAIITLASLDQAPALIDRIAPEHLALAVTEPDSLMDEVRNAGAIFLGRHTPEAIGDYIAGPNHVLPTARSARFASGLSVLDFVKRTSVVQCDAASLQKVGPAAVTLAEAEGLGAHALSVSLRLPAKKPRRMP